MENVIEQRIYNGNW